MNLLSIFWISGIFLSPVLSKPRQSFKPSVFVCYTRCDGLSKLKMCFYCAEFFGDRKLYPYSVKREQHNPVLQPNNDKNTAVSKITESSEPKIGVFKTESNFPETGNIVNSEEKQLDLSIGRFGVTNVDKVSFISRTTPKNTMSDSISKTDSLLSKSTTSESTIQLDISPDKSDFPESRSTTSIVKIGQFYNHEKENSVDSVTTNLPLSVALNTNDSSKSIDPNFQRESNFPESTTSALSVLLQM